jgi:hypothetical protein
MISKQWSTWEKKDKILPQTHSLEVEYSLFMAVMMVLTSERVEKRPGATPATFPPPIFAGIASVSVFCASLLPVIAIIKGGLYIGVFRSSWASRRKDGWQRRSQAQTSLGGTTWPGARATWSHLAPGPHLVDFLISRCFSW